MKSKSKLLQPIVLLTLGITLSSVLANPLGENVAAGSASFDRSGNTLSISTSDKVIINWQDFSIGSGEITKFLQPSSTSSALNRVITGNPSSILGNLEANGQVYLINPNGILVGAGSRIDTAGFVASTLDVSDSAFMTGGDLTFSGSSTVGIQNFGSIHALGGDVFLMAHTVENSGAISAPQGRVGLAAGNEILLSKAGNDSLLVRPSAVSTSPNGSGVVNRGLIEATQVELKTHGNMYAFALNNEGVIRVTGAVEKDGRVILTADGGTILNTGEISAKNHFGEGGSILISASAASLGGKIQSDGTQGGIVEVNADHVSLAGAISARGSEGKGGAISLRSNVNSVETSSSQIDASGSTGGNITHLAGHGLLSSGDYDVSGVNGKGGTITLSAPEMTLLSANLQASGKNGGGTILIGGEDQGGKNLSTDLVPNAQHLSVSSGTHVLADATGNDGDGGHIVFWSDQKTTVFTDVSARPGQASGNGGFVEISSGDELLFGATVQTGIGNRQGSLLLDPKNITIAEPGISQYSLILGNGYTGASSVSSLLEASDEFGEDVSLSGNSLAVGTWLDDGFGNGAANSGAVYLFTFSDSAFSNPSLQGIIGSGYVGGKNHNLTALEAGDQFGGSVSLDGSRLAVGAHLDDGSGNSTADSGSVYLFNFSDRTFTTPTLQATIGKGYTGGKNYDLSALEANDWFGHSVSLNGNRLVAGALNDDGSGNTVNNAGAAYLFSFSDNSFTIPTLQSTIGNGYTGGNNYNITLDALDAFGGSSVSLDGNRLAIGAFGDDGVANGVSAAGAAYLFSFADSTFSTPTLQATIGSGYTGGKNYNLTLASEDFFGQSVSLYGTGLGVGAHGDDGSGSDVIGAGSGAVYLFSFADNSFSSPVSEAIIGKNYTGGKNYNLSALGANDNFSTSMSFNDGRLVVGAQKDDGSGDALADSGAVYFFKWGDSVNSAIFGTDSSLEYTLSPRALAGLLESGQSITLQANNDINVNGTITVNNSSGNGGNLTLQAGRSILVNSSITTDNGNLSLLANQSAINGAVSGQRDAGPGMISFGAGASLNVGSGALTLTVANDPASSSDVVDFVSSSASFQGQKPVGLTLASLTPNELPISYAHHKGNKTDDPISISSSRSGDMVSISSFTVKRETSSGEARKNGTRDIPRSRGSAGEVSDMDHTIQATPSRFSNKFSISPPTPSTNAKENDRNSGRDNNRDRHDEDNSGERGREMISTKDSDKSKNDFSNKKEAVEDHDSNIKNSDNKSTQEKGVSKKDSSKSDDDSKSTQPHTNRSGGADGTNPGGHGNDSGYNNPGGSKK